MTVLKTHGLQQDEVKVRWEEPYVSAAINRALMALPRGVYSGFVVKQQATPAKGVLIKTTGTLPYHLALVTDVASGYKAVVQKTDEFNLDIPYTTAGVSQTYYVWIDIEYSVSAETAGYVRAGGSADRTVNSLTIAKIVVPASQAVINDADITQDPTDPDTLVWPVPDDSEYNAFGLVDEAHYLRIPTQDQKDAMDNASSPSASNPFATQASVDDRVWGKKTAQIFTGLTPTISQVQLSGWFYVGTGGPNSADKFFQLARCASGIPRKEGLRDSYGRAIQVSVFDNTDTDILDPSTDPGVDANGFYQNPILKFSIGFDGTQLAVFCAERSTYANMTVDQFFLMQQGILAPVHQETLEYLDTLNAKRPTTLTVSADSNALVDYAGATSLQNAINAVQTAVQKATIFVKNGTYTINANMTINDVAMEVVGESVDGVIINVDVTTGDGILIDTIHAVFKNCTFNLVSGDNVFTLDDDAWLDLHDCTVKGLTDITGDDPRIRAYRTVFQREGDYAVRIVGGTGLGKRCLVKSVFSDCTFNGTGAAKDQAGGGLAFILAGDQEVRNTTFDRCEFYARGAFNGLLFNVNGLFTEGMAVRDCIAYLYAAYGSAFNRGHAFHFGVEGRSVLTVENLMVKVLHTDTIQTPLVAFRALTYSTILASGVNIEGNANALDLNAGDGIVRLVSGGLSADATVVEVAGVNIHNLGVNAAFTANKAVSVGIEGTGAKSIATLRDTDLTRELDYGTGGATAIQITAFSTVNITRCVLDGSNQSSGADRNYRGIFCDTTAEISITDCTIGGYILEDIKIDNSGASTIMKGSRWFGRIDGYRCWFDGGEVTISDCIFDNTGGSSTAGLVVLTDSARARIMGNKLLHTSATAYAVDAYSASDSTFLGNTGVGYIHYKTGAGHIGLGLSTAEILNQGLTAYGTA